MRVRTVIWRNIQPRLHIDLLALIDTRALHIMTLMTAPTRDSGAIERYRLELFRLTVLIEK